MPPLALSAFEFLRKILCESPLVRHPRKGLRVMMYTEVDLVRENGICQNWNLSESVFCHFWKKLEFVRIGICQNWNLSESEFVRIGICQNWNLSELEFVRIGICQNWNLSEYEFVSIGICQNWNLSESEFARIGICQNFKTGQIKS